MEKERSVSFWIGNSKSDEGLLEYVELVYTDDGVSAVKFNSGILLYNFKYDGNVGSVSNKDYEFKFIGSVGYSE